MILFFFFVVIFVPNTNAKIAKKITEEPIIKSFQVDGDIIDCINIYKQPAFSHPLLKNHKIQMRPQGIPNRVLAKSLRNNTSSQDFLNRVSCPYGTVPIKRITNEDQKMEKYLNYLVSNYSIGLQEPTTSQGDMHNYYAKVRFMNKNLGTIGTINIWNPQNVGSEQMSSASLLVMKTAPDDATSAIGAGWMVNPKVFKDQKTRLFTFWTADGGKTKGCFNTFCPGLVLVNSNIYLGSYFRTISTYDGKNYEVGMQIYQDASTKLWWFLYQGIYVGYWPKELIPNLQNGADYVSWGGHVGSPAIQVSPEMGSGHFPSEGLGKSAFIKQLVVIKPDFQYYDLSEAEEIQSDPNCYKVSYNEGDEAFGRYIIFGGPGNCRFV